MSTITQPDLALNDPSNYLLVEPYAIFQLGPVKITTEVDWVVGKIWNGTTKADLSSWNGWVDAEALLVPFILAAWLLT